MKIASKIIVITAGSVILLIYCLPLVAGILNIGNIFGIGVGIILILFGRFLDRLGRKFICAFCILAIAGASIFGITMSKVVIPSDKSILGTEPIIVLGCQVRGDKPSIALKNRTMLGVDYLKNNPNTVAVLCGGQGSGENISEAECMKRIMLEYGIDESRIFIEDKSTSTKENIMYAKDILDENNLGSDIVIATSEYHCYRAQLIAESFGLTSKSIPAHGDKFSLPTFYTREVFGVWMELIKQI